MLNGIANQACDAGDESCADIVDARERKRIQNRIAQRTYRGCPFHDAKEQPEKRLTES